MSLQSTLISEKEEATPVCQPDCHEDTNNKGEARTEIKKKTIFPTSSRNFWDLIFALIFMGIIVGIAAGVQAMFQGSKARGVFSDLCSAQELHAVAVNGTDEDGAWCDAQEAATAVVADALFSFLNAISFANGIFVDATGGRRSAIVYCGMWAVATCAAGLNYTQGYVWAACMLLAIWGVEGAMMSVLVFHLRIICSERKDLYNFWSGGFTSLWDFGTFISIPVGRYWLREATAVPFELSWAIMGVVFAIPTLMWLITFSRRNRDQLVVADGLQMMERRAVKRYEEEGGGSGKFSLELETDRPPLTFGQALCTSLRTTKVVLSQLVTQGTFWLLVLQATTTVTTSAFFIATIGLAVKRLGGDAADVSQGRFLFAYLRGASGLLYFVPSFLAQRLGVLRGLCFMHGFCALNVLGIMMAALFEPEGYSLGRTILYIVVFSFWRAFSFSALNISILDRFDVQFGDNLAFIYGLVYSIGGTTSLILGAIFTSYVHGHQEDFVLVLGGMCIVTAVAHIVVGCYFSKQSRDLQPQQSEEGSCRKVGMLREEGTESPVDVELKAVAPP